MKVLSEEYLQTVRAIAEREARDLSHGTATMILLVQIHDMLLSMMNVREVPPVGD